MRILMLMQRFEPEPFLRGLVFAKELQKRGHKVQVLTSFPNYPGGKVYDGYKIKLFQREVMEGVPIVRVPIYPSHDRSSIKRILTYLSFALSAAILGPILVKPADVLYVYHPPATIALPAFVLRLIYRMPFIYDIQDLWPDTLTATGMINNKAALKLVGSWTRFIDRHTNRIAVLSPGFKEKLIERGVSEKKIHIVRNWCNEDEMHSTAYNETLAKELGLDGYFNVVFAGNMGKAQALESALEAAKELQDKVPNIQFVFIGGGIEVPHLKSLAADMILTNVRFLERRPMSEIGEILSLADVLFVHLKNDPLFAITIPSKTQAYLAMGRPILIGVQGDAAQLVEEANAGLSCEPENPGSIAEKLTCLYHLSEEERRQMGINGRQYYKNNLSVKAGVDRFEDIFKDAVDA